MPAAPDRRLVSDYWDAYAEAYDAEPDHGLLEPATRAAWRDLLRRALPERPADVLDLACGTGTLTVLAAELGHRVVGVDLSAGMLARAAAKVTGTTSTTPSTVALVRADVTSPGVRPASADVVVARHIVWTLPRPEQALAAWLALLRPGGRLVLVEGRWWSVGDQAYDNADTMPWSGGVRAADLADALDRVAGRAGMLLRTQVTPLADPALWGRRVTDERYLLTAVLGGRARRA